MTDPTLVQIEARHRISEAIRRADQPSLPHVPHRHRFAERLRRLANRIDN
jgi:hypothetical protein